MSSMWQAVVAVGVAWLAAGARVEGANYAWVGGDGNWSDIAAVTGDQGWDTSPYPTTGVAHTWTQGGPGATVTITIDVADALISDVPISGWDAGHFVIETTDAVNNKLNLNYYSNGNSRFGVTGSSQSLTVNAPVVLGSGLLGGRLRFMGGQTGAARVFMNGAISGAGGIGYTKPSATSSYNGNVRLSAANTFTGDTVWTYPTSIGGVGGLELYNTHALQNSTLDVGASDQTGGRVEFIAAGTHVVGGLTGGRDVDLDGKTVQFGNNNASTTYSGAIDNGALGKIGTGTLTLSGASIYTGNTTVDDGTLTLADGGELLFKIEGDGVNNALLGTGTVNLDGAFRLDLSAASSTVGHSWMIVDHAGLTETYGATFAIADFTDQGDGTWTKTVNPTYEFDQATGYLTVIPEPGSLLLLGLGGLALAMRRRFVK
ncbi:MAG: autotransporter-associated beta strand repeat-containing protein [Candidatus Marinimicrobia bacterium]|nr:autotransporter-associated beta strand repeat-containing protein [Candidatus Neomarinimicrobiota bacterium]